MKAFRSPIIALSSCLALVACPGESDDNGETAPSNPASSSGTPTPEVSTDTPSTEEGGSTNGTPPATTTNGSSGTTAAPGDTGTTAGPPIFDLGEIPEAPLIDDECGKVDFLFVIDNSGSMGNEQANLVANFPAFIDGIQTILEQVEEYQVGIVTTDAYTYNVPGCNQLSSLVVQTGGANSSNMACGPYADGANYMTEMDDLATAFSCAAQVGTVGSASERAMQAMVETVQKLEGDPGECNEGFIRDDALLVIVVITDEPDNGSTGDPMSWYDEVVLAKAGIPENVVVVSLINTPGGVCGGGVANDMAAFTTMFGVNGFLADICTPDYAPIFQQAVGVIDIACDNYIPPA